MKKLLKKNRAKAAFSLVELIIYVAIVSTIMTSLILFSINMLNVRGRAEFDREVIENARFVMNYITQEVHDAEDLNGGTFGVNPGSVTLDIDGGGTLLVDTDTKTVGSQTITFIQVDGVQVTSDKVNVINFLINNLTRGIEEDNLQFHLTLQSLDGAADVTVQTSISLRE